VTTEQVKALAEKYYGPIPARPVPARIKLDEPPKIAAIRLTMKSNRVTDVSWNRAYLAPSYHSGETRYAYALQVLAEVLGGGATSRLYRGLVVDQGIAIAAEAFYDPQPLGLASFGFDATLRKDVPVADFEAALEKIVKAALADGLTEDEVARAKARMQTAAIYDQDGIMGPARIIGSALASGRTLEDVQSWPDRIGAVTLDEVNAAARLVIHDDVAVTAVLLPQPTS
jgi:zinc protease